MEMIQTEKLVYEYEKRDEEGNVIGTSRAIDEVDIEAKEGQFIAILGHNGSGKSTLECKTVGGNGISESGQSDHWHCSRRRCGVWSGEPGRSDG